MYNRLADGGEGGAYVFSKKNCTGDELITKDSTEKKLLVESF
jgi:hypothetical protein